MSRKRKNSNLPRHTSPAPASPPAAIDKPTAWLAAVILGLAIGVVYGPFLNVPLIFDDGPAILQNPSITSLVPLVGKDAPGPLNPPPDLPTSGRPLVNLSFAVNYKVGGIAPIGYHAVNALIHFLSSLLLWAVVRRTLLLPYFRGQFDRSAGWLALAAALVWALHPLQTETVIYATQRTELMVAFFLFTSFFAALRYWETIANSGQGDVKWLAVATIACWCGMASKEVMVVAPLLILLYERTFISGSLPNALRRSWPLYAGLASSLLLLLALSVHAPRSQSAGFHLRIPPYSYWLTQTQVIVMYFKLVVWPHPLLLHYEPPLAQSIRDVWHYALVVLAIGLGTLWLLWKNRPAGFVGTWVFAILAPTSLVPIVTEIAAERRMYLPLAAIAAFVVVGAVGWLQRRWAASERARSDGSAAERAAKFVTIAACALATLYGIASAAHLTRYRNEILLWRDVVLHQPRSWYGNNNLGKLLSRAEQWPEAEEKLRISTEVRPDREDAFSDWGFTLVQLGRLPEAYAAFQKSLAIRPDFPKALGNLGFALNQEGRHGEAIPYLQKAIKLDPNRAEPHNDLGIAYAQTNGTAQAIIEFRKVLEIDPAHLDAHKNLGLALVAEGELPASIDEFRAYLARRPDEVEIRYDLASVLLAVGRGAEAVAEFTRAAHERPDLLQPIAESAIESARTQGHAPAAAEVEAWLRARIPPNTQR